MDNEILKKTLQSSTKMRLLEAAIKLLEHASITLVKLGMTYKSISFLLVSLDMMALEVEQAVKSIRIEQKRIEFNNIVKNLKNFGPEPDKDKNEG